MTVTKEQVDSFGKELTELLRKYDMSLQVRHSIHVVPTSCYLYA